jgi:iron(III) transport system permease protein
MIGLGWLRTTARGALGLILVAPFFGLLVAVLFDRGPSGEPRLSPHLFPVVLWIFDDFAWTCARNSLVFASVLALLSLVLGVAVCSLLGWLPPWGRTILGGMFLAMVVVPPAFLALGLTALLAHGHPWPWLPRLEWVGGSPGASLETWRGAPLWIVWLWASLPAAGALVSLAIEPVIARMEPSWEEAARLAGAGRFRNWTKLSWPIIRPRAARAAGVVFLTALVEPGVPWILGLRRTVAFQIVDAAAQPDPFPGAAAWALAAWLFGVCAWAIFRSRGGPTILKSDSIASSSSGNRPYPRRVSARLVLASSLALTAWALACALPILGLLRLWLGAGMPPSASERGTIPGLKTLLQHACEPPAPELAANSVVLGFEVACAIAVVAWLVRRQSPARAAASLRARLLRLVAQMPPLVQSLGLVALCWVVGMAAGSLPVSNTSATGLALERFATAMAPQQNPWPLLVGCVSLALVPWFATGEAPLGHRDPSVPRRDSALEVALLAGPSRLRARALAARWRYRAALARFVFVWALAATNVTPAVLFLPWTFRRCLGPAVLVYSALDRAGQSLAAALAVAAVAVNVVAFLVARACWAGPRCPDLE